MGCMPTNFIEDMLIGTLNQFIGFEWFIADLFLFPSCCFLVMHSTSAPSATKAELKLVAFHGITIMHVHLM